MILPRENKLLSLFFVLAVCFSWKGMAVSEAVKEAYPEFAKYLGELGYEWEAHEVKTEDGWYLTLFRVLGTSQKNRSEDD